MSWMYVTSNIKQTRRLQLVGGSTHIISLPRSWIDDLHLKPGSYLSLVKNQNDSITIFQESEKKLHAIATIGKNDSEESIRRKIIAIYLSGYNVIEIRTKGMEIPGGHRGIIRDLVRTTLMGTEIIEASSERMVLQVLTQLAQLSFDVALKRMYITTTNMHRDAIHALKEFDTDYADEVTKMDDEVDRFALYMMRNLSLALEDMQVLLDSGLKKSSECLEYRSIVKFVERIADHAALVAKKVKHLNSPIDKKTMIEVEAISIESLSVFENSMTALSKRDYSLAEKTAASVSCVIEREKKLMNTLKQDSNVAILKLILEDIRRTAEYSSDIAEVVMDGTVHTVVKAV
ncbi:MAG: phosphate uptake regulator PhoU [Thaumarchaeota archaeon]|nr:phosphate uptake regulator PhoU [Nitrososphaerota archaeon]